jgi:RimJ/RimL family protein N-acetyltransferase
MLKVQVNLKSSVFAECASRVLAGDVVLSHNTALRILATGRGVRDQDDAAGASDPVSRRTTAKMSDVKQIVNSAGLPIGPAVPGWVPRPRPPRTPMVGQYAVLEPVNVEKHGADLFSAYMEAPDGRDWTYLSVERPDTELRFREYLTRLTTSDDPLHHAIVDRATGRALGTASFMRIEPAHGVVEVGHITYSPALKRTRIATEAMYLMMRRAFDELGYRRYEWKCDSLNAPSRTAALRYGFTFEGVFRKAIIYKGRSRDTAWYSITDEEWVGIRGAFESWLDPRNFDAEGRQRSKLTVIRSDQTRV